MPNWMNDEAKKKKGKKRKKEKRKTASSNSGIHDQIAISQRAVKKQNLPFHEHMKQCMSDVLFL